MQTLHRFGATIGSGARGRHLAGVVALGLVVASTAGAQIIRVPPRSTQQVAWLSAGIGYLSAPQLFDGTTNAEWRFSDAFEYRVSLEKGLQGGSSFGLAVSNARTPLRYLPAPGFVIGAGGADCTFGCDADANISRITGLLHMGRSSVGFYQAIDLSVGATVFWNFRDRASGDRLAPTSDTDLALAIGYGFGYGFSPDMQIELVQDAGLGIHQRENLPAGTGATYRMYNTRLAVRFGLGAR